jgi:hypothetical protein
MAFWGLRLMEWITFVRGTFAGVARQIRLEKFEVGECKPELHSRHCSSLFNMNIKSNVIKSNVESVEGTIFLAAWFRSTV